MGHGSLHSSCGFKGKFKQVLSRQVETRLLSTSERSLEGEIGCCEYGGTL